MPGGKTATNHERDPSRRRPASARLFPPPGGRRLDLLLFLLGVALALDPAAAQTLDQGGLSQDDDGQSVCHPDSAGAGCELCLSGGQCTKCGSPYALFNYGW